jgi:hypothetical protein
VAGKVIVLEKKRFDDGEPLYVIDIRAHGNPELLSVQWKEFNDRFVKWPNDIREPLHIRVIPVK